MTERERLIGISRTPLNCLSPAKCNVCSENNICRVHTTADYLLANGVIVPPCKVGDMVYCVFEGRVLKNEIILIEITESEVYFSTRNKRYWLKNGYLYSAMFDEKAYFTKEEAEKALKEREK